MLAPSLQITLAVALSGAPEDGGALAAPTESAEPAAASRDLAGVDLPVRQPPPPEYGPFYADEAPSDTAFPSGPKPSARPIFSVAGGALCFLEDAKCKASLLASAEIAAGANLVAGDRGVDVPLTQYGFRGGFTVRPLTLARGTWNRWGVGLVGTWYRNSGTLATEASTMGSSNPDYIDVRQTDGLRVGLVNQLWLSQRRHAPHLDFTIGVVRSRVLTSQQAYLGTHADVALGFGGWGSIFLSGDFLDQDARLTFGLRGHAVAAAPVVVLVLLGMLAGGAM